MQAETLQVSRPADKDYVVGADKDYVVGTGIGSREGLRGLSSWLGEFRFSEMNERELFKKEAEHRSPWQQRENEILIQSEIDFR